MLFSNSRVHRNFIFLSLLLFALVCGHSFADTGVKLPESGGSVGSTAEVSTDYRLGIGDKLAIDVYNEADLSVISTVSQTGSISYPFLGDIKIAGLTIKEVSQKIASGLKGAYLVDPVVGVSIVQYRPFFIHGEVRQSGSFPYQPGLTLRKAVSLAGGFTDRASQSKMTVIRETDPQHSPVPIKIDDLVYPGDTITIEQSFF